MERRGYFIARQYKHPQIFNNLMKWVGEKGDGEGKSIRDGRLCWDESRTIKEITRTGHEKSGEIKSMR